MLWVLKPKVSLRFEESQKKSEDTRYSLGNYTPTHPCYVFWLGFSRQQGYPS